MTRAVLVLSLLCLAIVGCAEMWRGGSGHHPMTGTSP